MRFDFRRGGARVRAVRMRLHADWRRILRRSWSLRLAVIAGVLDAANVACEFLPRDSVDHRTALAGLATFVSLAAALARLVAQSNMGSE